MAPVITLTTDFGTDDAYVASMKGVILTISPEAAIVDICHSIEPRNILQASFILSTTHRYFPEGTVHVAVVDPGVGSERKAIILKTPSSFFVAPDNGILSYILDEFCPTSPGVSPSTSINMERRKLGVELEAIAITNSEFWQHPVSTTFHGRDIFAPVAGHLSLGTPLHRFGDSVEQLNVFPLPQPFRDNSGNLDGCILHIDHFGNLITSIRDNDLPGEEFLIEVCNQRIQNISRFYAEKEGLAAIIGSSGYLEISLKDGNAASALGAKISDLIKISRTIA